MRTYGDQYYAGPGPSSPAKLTNGAAGSWTVQSGTFDDVQYEVVRTPDGFFSCNCPGCRYQARADGECKHIDQVRGWIAGSGGQGGPILAGATAAGEPRA